MKLEKLYLDIVAEDGAGLICHAADTTLGGLAFHPASLLAWGRDRERAATRRRVRAVDEKKWLARGYLSMPDGGVDEGWVIHEAVVLRGRQRK